MTDTAKAPQPNFVIQKIFTKDVSFEAPNTPDVFKSNWQPDANVSVNTRASQLEDNIHEVELTLTVTVKNGETNAYLIEVTQAGIFTVENMAKAQVDGMLGAYCPTTLFPYAKEAIDGLINKGGFPQINLAPINFDALYMQKASTQQTSEVTRH